jgi:DinB superfamily
MNAQSAFLFSTLSSISEEILWGRSPQDEWSPGENLSHVAVVHRFFRRLNRFLWPIASLIGRSRTDRQFETAIDDVYTRPAFPHFIGRLWPPEYSPRRPVSLNSLCRAISIEHQLVRDFYQKREPLNLGRALLYIPAIGWINYIQSLQIAVFHDAHHFDEIRKVVSAVEGSSSGA